MSSPAGTSIRKPRAPRAGRSIPDLDVAPNTTYAEYLPCCRSYEFRTTSSSPSPLTSPAGLVQLPIPPPVIETFGAPSRLRTRVSGPARAGPAPPRQHLRPLTRYTEPESRRPLLL